MIFGRIVMDCQKQSKNQPNKTQLKWCIDLHNTDNTHITNFHVIYSVHLGEVENSFERRSTSFASRHVAGKGRSFEPKTWSKHIYNIQKMRFLDSFSDMVGLCRFVVSWWNLQNLRNRCGPFGAYCQQCHPFGMKQRLRRTFRWPGRSIPCWELRPECDTWNVTRERVCQHVTNAYKCTRRMKQAALMQFCSC